MHHFVFVLGVHYYSDKQGGGGSAKKESEDDPNAAGVPIDKIIIYASGELK
jgi:hypothetical protein